MHGTKREFIRKISERVTREIEMAVAPLKHDQRIGISRQRRSKHCEYETSLDPESNRK